jgi:putative transposase
VSGTTGDHPQSTAERRLPWTFALERGGPVGREKRIVIPGMAYHVVNRATERRTIFHKPADYAAFLALVAKANARFPIELLAYCVMPNHWHLVLRPLASDALSMYMHWLTGRHVSYYRYVHGTIGNGHLYQGRFRSPVVESDFHYWNVLRYVEANALRAGLVSRAEDWQWGSLFERQLPALRLLTPQTVPLPSNWVEIVNSEMDALELAKLRESLARCMTLPNVTSETVVNCG